MTDVMQKCIMLRIYGDTTQELKEKGRLLTLCVFLCDALW